MNGADYMGRVALLRCAICARLGFVTHGVHVHHRRAGTGGGRRASDFQTIPLCPEHHQGATGIHGLGTKAFATTYALTEAELVLETWNLVGVTAEAVEVWERDHRDRRRQVRQSPRSPKVDRTDATRSRWPSRKLASANRLRARPRSET